MVYFHTSENVKILRNIIIDYGASKEISPIEYMKTYVDRCPDDVEDVKISWIAKTFLDIQKHGQFLKTLTSHLSEELTEEEQDYFMILFHAVAFQIDSKEMQLLYKCLFNLSKSLLSTFTNFLGNNESLTFISHVAHSFYDTNYITEKVINPIFTWQPYISEMGHNYGEYVHKKELRKIKPKTIPIQPNVLNRKITKNTSPPPAGRLSLPATPPNSLKVKQKKMLTKSVIDQRLKKSHEKNKQKAANLLNNAKTITKEYNYAQDKSSTYFKKLSAIRDEIDNEVAKPCLKLGQKHVLKHSDPPPTIKETTTTLKRLNKRVQLTEQDEIQWLSDLVSSCKLNTSKIEELIDYERKAIEKERLYDMERKHLEGQISYEEALIAKRRLVEENKKKYEEFLKEKELWNEEIENWRKSEIEKNRKQVEHLCLLELNVRQAKIESKEKKKALVEQLKKESEILQQQVMIQKKEELQKRVNMIKEIKILALVAKKARVPKVIDLTETSGLGLFCEISMAELQERLNIMKIGLQEELHRKREIIKKENMAAKQDLEQTKESIKTFMAEHTTVKKRKKKSKITLSGSPARDIDNLKNILEEKKKLRAQLTS